MFQTGNNCINFLNEEIIQEGVFKYSRFEYYIQSTQDIIEGWPDVDVDYTAI